ncbi:MAG: RagB/SusD family nutrient uptake outer membrane protein [Bacteroidales bacterium]|nr:RagB/SusD family nutrient uptake outer membrane protein [Bacteroidales bacterium]
MKKFFGIIALTTLVLSSCNGFLDEEAYSKFSKEDAYSNPTLVYLNTVASVYSSLDVLGLAYDCDFSAPGLTYISEFSSDLGIIQGRRSDWVDGGAHQQIFLQTWSPSHAQVKVPWTWIYKIIGLCNSSIDDIQSMLDVGGESFLQTYIDELRAIRVFCYMQAVNLYGRVPIVTTSKTTVADVGQSTRSKGLEFLCTELDAIVANMSNLSGIKSSSEYYGRMTKGAVYAMMAKVAANAAVWSKDTWNDGTFTGGVEKVGQTVTDLGKAYNIKFEGQTRNAWETVIYCQQRLAELGYKLNPNVKANFSYENENSVENIFIRPNSPTIKLRQRYMTYSLHSKHANALGAGAGSNGIAASQHAAEIFDVQFDPATEECTSEDPRWDMFFYAGPIYVNGERVPLVCEYRNTLAYLPYSAKVDHGSPLAGSKEEYEMWCAGARIKKVEVEKEHGSFSWAFCYQDADIVVYRYADILLLAAEANYRLGNPGKALDMINEVRNRVSAPVATASELDLQYILDERGRELCWEPTRREDLIRFGEYTEPTIDKYEGVPAATGAGAWAYDQAGNHLVLPIPVDVLNLNTNLTQNPGY